MIAYSRMTTAQINATIAGAVAVKQDKSPKLDEIVAAPSIAAIHNHDNAYYTEAEVDALIAAVPGGEGNPSAAWPVGSVFLSVLTTNPSVLLGFGTWEAIGP